VQVANKKADWIIFS